MHLMEQKVEYTSIDPVRIGVIDEDLGPVNIWVGVFPGSLPSEHGIKVAVGLRALLLANNIEVGIRESAFLYLCKDV